jgi:predicted dehydrogenase
MSADKRRRLALIGAGARAEMWIQAVTGPHAGRVELVALADVNQARMDAHNRWLGDAAVPTYPAAALERMLADQRVDQLLVTSVDRTHAGQIVTALEAGCDVITEKPMTVDAESAQSILDAVERTGRDVKVAFNYRFNPVHEVVRTLLAGGAVGEIG